MDVLFINHKHCHIWMHISMLSVLLQNKLQRDELGHDISGAQYEVIICIWPDGTHKRKFTWKGI